MILFPAVDILDNRAVRLLYGQRDKVTDYGDPVELALRWSDIGAQYLHVVDLNGAFDDSAVNRETLKKLVKELKIPVQLGGGIKTLDKIKYYLEEVGVTRVIVGTACVTAPDVADKACALYGNKIVAGIDCKDGFVAIKGWVEKSDLTAQKVALDMKARGSDTVVYTDISRDGALTGVNVDATAELAKNTGMKIIASGGMSCIDDIKKLMQKDVYGAILGRAIYNGNIDLSDALETVNRGRNAGKENYTVPRYKQRPRRKRREFCQSHRCGRSCRNSQNLQRYAR